MLKISPRWDSNSILVARVTTRKPGRGPGWVVDPDLLPVHLSWLRELPGFKHIDEIRMYVPLIYLKIQQKPMKMSK